MARAAFADWFAFAAGWGDGGRRDERFIPEAAANVQRSTSNAQRPMGEEENVERRTLNAERRTADKMKNAQFGVSAHDFLRSGGLDSPMMMYGAVWWLPIRRSTLGVRRSTFSSYLSSVRR
jgi:hypothetical protein